MRKMTDENPKKLLISSTDSFKRLTCHLVHVLSLAFMFGISGALTGKAQAQDQSVKVSESSQVEEDPGKASTPAEALNTEAPTSASLPTTKTPANQIVRKITDDEWNQIAGEKRSQRFPVEKGNTLWGISKELFGDPMYWPKIWALNNGSILNPHIIKPGQQVTFQGGSSSALPSIGIQDTEKETTQAGKPPSASADTTLTTTESEFNSPEDSAIAATQTGQSQSSLPAVALTSSKQIKPASFNPEPSALSDPDRSREWMKLPLQEWENPQGEPVTAENMIHDQAKDSSGAPVRLRSWPDRGIQLEGLPESEQLTGIATIVGSRKEGLVLGKGDMIYIEADTELVEGETYGITSEEPTLMKTRKSDRSGWLHPYLGKVRILAVKEGVYVGEILESAGPIQRDDLLIPLPAKAFPKQPIPAANPLEATLLLNKDTSMYATSQFKQVIIDRGSGDGVYPGMVFRSYQYWDPGTGDRFTDSDFIIDADILVVHSGEDFSVGIVLSSLSPVTEGSTLVLLTDISDVLDKNGYRLRTQEEVKRDEELKELDQLPPQSQLEEAERRELEQLEKWQKNPEGTEELIEDPEKINELSEDTSQGPTEESQETEAGKETQTSEEELVPPEQPPTEDNPPPPPETEEDAPPPSELPPEESNPEEANQNESTASSEGSNETAGDESSSADTEKSDVTEGAQGEPQKADDYPQDEPIQGE